MRTWLLVAGMALTMGLSACASEQEQPEAAQAPVVVEQPSPSASPEPVKKPVKELGAADLARVSAAALAEQMRGGKKPRIVMNSSYVRVGGKDVALVSDDMLLTVRSNRRGSGACIAATRARTATYVVTPGSYRKVRSCPNDYPLVILSWVP